MRVILTLYYIIFRSMAKFSMKEFSQKDACIITSLKEGGDNHVS